MIYIGNLISINFINNPSCHTLSNAEAISKKIEHIFVPQLIDSNAFCVKKRILSLVCLFFLKPDCCFMMILFVLRKFLILVKIVFSHNLAIQLVMLMGLYDFGSSRSIFFFGIIVISDSFHSCGIFDSIRVLLNNFNNKFLNFSGSFLRIRLHILSSPELVLLFKSLMDLSSSGFDMRLIISDLRSFLYLSILSFSLEVISGS